MSPAAQQSLPLKVDCGDLNGFPAGEPGYLLLTQTSGPPGVTLTPAAQDTVHIAGNLPYFGVAYPSDVMTIDPDEVVHSHRLTALKLADLTVLSISGLAPNVLYRVKLELGAASPWYDLVNFVPTGTSTVSREVFVETQKPSFPGQWRPAARHVRCTAGYTGNTLQSFLGSMVPVWVLAQTDGSGVLRLRFSTAGADPVFLTAFEVHAYEALPMQYKRTAQGPLQGNAPGVAAFVSAFNAGNFVQAQALALALPDPFQRGVALAHLVGWLDGTRDGRANLIPDAQAALLLGQPSHPGAAWLLAQLDQYQRALAHLAARGYSDALLCPAEGGTGFLNTACAGQTIASFGQATTNVNAHIALRLLAGLCAPVNGTTVLSDLQDWNAGTLQPGAWEPSPLVFAAVKAYGVTIPTINPLLSVNAADPESVEFKQRFADVFNAFMDLGFAATDFPSDLELPLFRAYATNPLGHPKNWPLQDIASLFTPAQLDPAQLHHAWWAEDVALPPDDPDAPPWANLQRNYERLLQGAVRYWLTERWQHGELGGGWGDDVELIVQLMLPFAARQDQLDRPLVDRLESCVRYGLDEFPLVSDGYYSGSLTDVEHSAEFTTNPWLTLRGLYGHTARAVEQAFDVTRHLKNSSAPALAFAGLTTVGRLHFKSWEFTSKAIGTDPDAAADVALDGRALLPGIFTGFHAPLPTGHPLLADLRAWAGAWRDDALDTSALASGKPAGFLAPAQWPSNVLGKSGVWWSATGAASDVSLLGNSEASYVLELLRQAYRGSTASDRWKFLLPGVRMFRAVKDWEDAGKPANPAQGGAAWAGKAFKAGPRFGPIAFAWRDDLQSDPDLNALPDPAYGNSTTYVDAALLDRLRLWTEVEFNNQGSALMYALLPVEPCAPHSVKLTGNFENNYQNSIDYLRACYPLLTARCMHTDRTFLNQGGGNLARLIGHTGASLVEGLRFAPLATWRSRLVGAQDIAVQCNQRDVAGSVFSAFVHVFDPLPATLTLQLDEGLIAGRYLVETGAAQDNCDTFPASSAITSTTVQKRGSGASVVLTLNPGLSLVRVTRQGPADLVPQRWDLAVDPPRLQIVTGQGLPELHVSLRVVNGGSDPSQASTLKLYAAVTMPSGALIAFPNLMPETLVYSSGVPPLPGSTGFALASFDLDVPVAINPTIIDVLLSGSGIQLRAEVPANAYESDPLNNDMTRSWTLADLAIEGG